MMNIIIQLDKVLAQKNMGITELSDKSGIPLTSLYTLSNNQAEAVRLSTLKEICRVLECQPGDLMEYGDGE